MPHPVWNKETFEISSLTLSLPTDQRVTNQLGNPEAVIEKVTFECRFPPDFQSPRLITDQSTVQTEVMLTGRTLKPLDKRIRPGLICQGVINDVEGTIEIMPIAQNSLKAITRELGNRIRIKFTQSSRSLDSA